MINDETWLRKVLFDRKFHNMDLSALRESRAEIRSDSEQSTPPRALFGFVLDVRDSIELESNGLRAWRSAQLTLKLFSIVGQVKN